MSICYTLGMNKIFLGCFGLLILGITLVAYIYHSPSVSKGAVNETNFLPSEPEQNVPLDTQVGQVFMIGHWADTPVASTTALIEQYQLGGVIIMSAPEDPNEILSWTKEWNAVSKTPLFIAIDQEGGPVTRIKHSSYIQTGQRNISTEAEAYSAGITRGTELDRLGINMNFAPVLDSAQNPSSFMYSRTFPEGTRPAELAGTMIRAMAEADVIGVAKHFPGHDDTNVDSHNELPVVPIEQNELAAFTKAFSDLITHDSPRALMTAHVQFPRIDPMPATLSEFFLTTYLRNELGYTGIIVTDDISMDAIDTHYTATEASVLALGAGADLILLAAEPASIETIFPYVYSQAETSKVLQEKIFDSYRRNVSLKGTLR